MNQNDGLIKFVQLILGSMAMLKREIKFIVTMINRMLQARSLHGHIMEKQHTKKKGLMSTSECPSMTKMDVGIVSYMIIW